MSPAPLPSIDNLYYSVTAATHVFSSALQYLLFDFPLFQWTPPGCLGFLRQGSASLPSPCPPLPTKAPSHSIETLGIYFQLTSATVRMKYMDGCWGSMPSSFMPSLKPFLLWVTAWDCQCTEWRGPGFHLALSLPSGLGAKELSLGPICLADLKG